jgi:DNA modification methylase
VDWTEAYKLFPGHVAYVWHAARFTADLALNLGQAGLHVRAQIIWRKPRFAIGRGHYHWQHEPCWYAVREGGSAKWCGDRTQSTVWDINAKDQDAETRHGTQKPVECMARPVRNHGVKGDDVYDPFLGSGTTLIACERLGRRCYGLELSPAYCDVIVHRYENFTGKKAERIDAGDLTERTPARAGVSGRGRK